MRISQQDVQGIDRARRPVQQSMRHDGVRRIDWNGAERLLAAVGRGNEVQRLAGHVAADRDDRVGVPAEAINRQSNEGPAVRLSGLDREPRRLNARPARLRAHAGRAERKQQGKSAKGWVPGHGTNIQPGAWTTATRSRPPGTTY